MLRVTEEQFKNLIITFEGNGKAVAEHLGVTPSCVSARLKKKHGTWWASYKAGKAQKNQLLREARAEEFRKIVVRHKGNLQEIAQELGIRAPSVSVRLNSPENSAWWNTYKKTLAPQKERAAPSVPSQRAELEKQVLGLLVAISGRGCTNSVFEKSCTDEKLCELCAMKQEIADLKAERDSFKFALLDISETIGNL